MKKLFCRGCGEELLFTTTPTGKWSPRSGKPLFYVEAACPNYTPGNFIERLLLTPKHTKFYWLDMELGEYVSVDEDRLAEEGLRPNMVREKRQDDRAAIEEAK